MNRFSSRQIGTLILLNLITVLMLAGIFILPLTNITFGGTADVTENDTIPSVSEDVTEVAFDAYRSPRVGTEENIIWENNLGGSLQDEVISSFALTDTLIVFGNTYSSDYDFSNDVINASDTENGEVESDESNDTETSDDESNTTASGESEYRGYAIIFSYDGIAQSYHIFDGFITKAVMYDDCFLLCHNDSPNSIISKVDFYCNVLSSLTVATSVNEIIIDVYIDYFNSPISEPIHAVTEYTNQYTLYKEIKVVVINSDFTFGYERVFNRSASLEYVGAYSFSGGFYMFCNYIGYSGTFLTYYNWTKTNFNEDTRANLEISGISDYYCYDIIPTQSSRYLAIIIAEDAGSYLIDCYQNFAYYNIIPLSTSNTAAVALFSDNDYYYAYTYSTSDISCFYIIDSNIMIVSQVAALSSIKNLYCHTIASSGTFFTAQSGDNIMIFSISETVVTYHTAFIAPYETINNMIIDTYGIILIGTSTGISAIIGDNFGEEDIWIAKINL